MQQVLSTDVPSEIVTWIVKKLFVSNTVDKMPRESPTQGNFYFRIFDKNGNNNLDACFENFQGHLRSRLWVTFY